MVYIGFRSYKTKTENMLLESNDYQNILARGISKRSHNAMDRGGYLDENVKYFHCFARQNLLQRRDGKELSSCHEQEESSGRYEFDTI